MKNNKSKQKIIKPSNTHAFSIKKYPLFGRGTYSDSNPPKEVTQSPFYWWYKFLLLNDEYEQAINGKKSSIDKSVVKDFGDIKIQDFKSWWQKRVALFAEPQLNYKMMVAQNISEIAPFNNNEVINLVVPLNWTNIGIKRSFARVIDRLVPKVKPRERGVRVKESEAKYRLGRKWSIGAFESAHRIYVEKQKAEQEMRRGAKKVSWADIAIRAKLQIAEGEIEGKITSMTSDSRRVLTILAMRHYKRAEAYIKASATHTFPE